MDRRFFPSNDRVFLAGALARADGKTEVVGEEYSIVQPVADLMRTPKGARDRQLLLGETVVVLELFDGWVFVQAQKDGYVGYLRAEAVGRAQTASHYVCTRATHAYSVADLKSPENMLLSFGAQLVCIRRVGEFIETQYGFVPSAHLCPIAQRNIDPVRVAELLVETPYLWGGNSSFGIDCSGLVQLACWGAGRDAPADSDVQFSALGHMAPNDATRQRGDLVFWPGHVAWFSDPDTILHANAHHMAVRLENFKEAAARIFEQTGDNPLGIKRLQ